MSKKARSEGNRVATAIKANKANYYISDVNLEDNENDVIASATAIRRTLGKLEAGFMIISAGVSKLIVVVDLPDSPKLSAKDWLFASLSDISPNSMSNENTTIYAKSVIEIDTPFKYKDIVRSSGFAYLRKVGLLEEEESEEEFFFD